MLFDHFERVDADSSVRVLALTGSGTSTFCAGASLGALESGALTPERFETLAARLANVRVPTVAALNGSAFGGGAELALCCDFRLGVPGMRVAVPAARLGLCYPLGGIRRFVETLGLGAATRLLVGAEELDADELRHVGFLHRIVAPHDLLRAADERAASLAELAPLAAQAMKRLARDAAAGLVDEVEARSLVEACATSADLREGLAARREGRAPRFRGT